MGGKQEKQFMSETKRLDCFTSNCQQHYHLYAANIPCKLGAALHRTVRTPVVSYDAATTGIQYVGIEIEGINPCHRCLLNRCPPRAGGCG